MLGAAGKGDAESTKCLDLRVEQNERITSVLVVADNNGKYINQIRIATNGGQELSAGSNKGTTSIEISRNSGRYRVASGFLCGITGSTREIGLENQGWLKSIQFNFLQDIADGSLTNLTWYAEDMENDGTSSLGNQAITLNCPGPNVNLGKHGLKFVVSFSP